MNLQDQTHQPKNSLQFTQTPTPSSLANTRWTTSRGSEVYENCRKTVRAIQAATGPSAYSRVRWQTKFQPLQLSRLNPGGTLYEFIHQVQEIQKQQPIYKTELQGTLKNWILDAIRTEDPTTAQEVRLQCPREEVKPVINYLAEHFGTASQKWEQYWRNKNLNSTPCAKKSIA